MSYFKSWYAPLHSRNGKVGSVEGSRKYVGSLVPFLGVSIKLHLLKGHLLPLGLAFSLNPQKTASSPSIPGIIGERLGVTLLSEQ